MSKFNSKDCAVKPILKYDNNKPRLGLVPPASIQAIGEIMTYGLNKYEESSWKRVEAWRYRDALMRHLCEYLIDPYGLDEESGKPHLWHVITNAAFLCEIEDYYLKGNMNYNIKKEGPLLLLADIRAYNKNIPFGTELEFVSEGPDGNIMVATKEDPDEYIRIDPKLVRRG